MTTTYVTSPTDGGPNSSMGNIDQSTQMKLSQPVSPSAAQWHSVPELFTPFGQLTTGTARTSG